MLFQPYTDSQVKVQNRRGAVFKQGSSFDNQALEVTMGQELPVYTREWLLQVTMEFKLDRGHSGSER